MALLALNIDQEAPVTLTAADRAGNPAPLDGLPVWASEPAGVVDVLPAVDGMSAVVRALDELGEAVVTVRVDGDLGKGVREIVGLLSVAVTAGAATVVELTAGEAREKAA